MIDITDKIKIIHASGTSAITEKQKQLINRLLNEYYQKIQKQLKNEVFLEINIKLYEKAGKPATKPGKSNKFSIHIRIDSSAKTFEADYADWDLARTIHKVMNKIINEIEHNFHSSDQHNKIRMSQQVRKRGR